MVRRRDPRGSRRVAREFEELSSQCKAKAKNIAACLRASRQCHGPDLTGRRGSFTRSSLLRLLGQILRHKATPQLRARMKATVTGLLRNRSLHDLCRALELFWSLHGKRLPASP